MYNNNTIENSNQLLIYDKNDGNLLVEKYKIVPHLIGARLPYGDSFKYEQYPSLLSNEEVYIHIYLFILKSIYALNIFFLSNSIIT